MATPDLQRLGARVIERRQGLNLSLKRASTLAGLSKDTWMRVESGLPVRHLTYDKVEDALRWAVGSCRKVMDGGEPVLLDGGHGRIMPVSPEDLEAAVRGAVQDALILTTDDLTTTQIRDVNERAIGFLRDRGVLPPEPSED